MGSAGSLTKQYGSVLAIDNLSFEVQPDCGQRRRNWCR